MSNYIILLPPSEGKEIGGNIEFLKVRDKNSFQNLEVKRTELIDHIQEVIPKLKERELEKIFEVKGKNIHEPKRLKLNLQKEKTLQAIQRFSGIMFKAIDYESIEKKENFTNSIIFVDGLFGLLKPLDLIPNYKLKISAKVGDLDITKFWKEVITKELKEISKGKIIIDILPEAHRKVIEDKKLDNILRIHLKEKKEGVIRSVGHNSKQLKGEIVRFIVGKEEIKEEDLRTFKHSYGLKYSKELSKNNDIVLLKD